MTAANGDDLFGFVPYKKNISKEPEPSMDFGFVPYNRQTKAVEYYIPQAEEEENFMQSAMRTASNVGVGIAEGSPYGIATGLMNLIGTGEAFDPLEIERLKEIAEREGIPFDEQKYLEAAKAASQYFPTPGNIANIIEEQTGLPTKSKNEFQKLARLGGTAGRFTPGTAIQKTGGAVVAPAMAHQLKEQYGLPEPLADTIGLLMAHQFGSKNIPPVELGAETKPSGLPTRGFESLEKPREVSIRKMAKINRKVESDFRGIVNNIIAESPVGETAENLANNPVFKEDTRALMAEAQTIADTIPEPVNTDTIQEQIINQIIKRPTKGYMLNEYERSYYKNLDTIYDEIPKGEVTTGQLVEQFRKNNSELSELFEPGQSKATNRGKRDALLEHNRAIAAAMEKNYPDSELVRVFKEGNDRWSKIMDVEAIDSFIDSLFEGKINFKEIDTFFDKEGFSRPFKRSLGEDGYKEFTQLLKDLSSSKKPYQMLKVAKEKGFGDLASTASLYMFSQKLGALKTAKNIGMAAWKMMMNAMLDKPRLAFKFKKAIDELSDGKFPEAARDFSILEKEIEVLPPENAPQATPKTPENQIEPIEVSGETIQPEKKLLKGPTEKTALKKFREPKLVEYKPKSTTPQDRQRFESRRIFEDAVQGKKLTPSQDNVLLNTRVSPMETRGMGQQYHGTKNPIRKLNENIYDVSSERNIYGAGFYTTDALDIADGYSKPKNAIGKIFPYIKNPTNPTVYEVNEIKPQNLYNLEQPIDDFKQFWIDNQSKHLEYLDYDEYLITQILQNDNPKTLRELYDKILEEYESEQGSAISMQGDFIEIQNILEEQGYQGLSHTGGIFTNNPAHLVKIYWNPENLEISEYAYPKEFKKVSKVSKSIKPKS